MVGHFTSALDLGPGTRLVSAGKNDVVVAGFGAAGDVRWAHRLGGPEGDYGYAVTALAQGVGVAGMEASHGFVTWLPRGN